MGLYVDSSIKESFVAKEPIKVYKILRKGTKKYYTPVMNRNVNIRKDSVLIPDWCNNIDNFPKSIGLIDYKLINNGFIHTFVDIDSCIDWLKSGNVSGSGYYIIFESVIPKGEKYYKGKINIDSPLKNSYASKSIKLNRTVSEVSVKEKDNYKYVDIKTF